MAASVQDCRRRQNGLFVGNSSDQDVQLLRHLPFDDTDSFVRANWRVWRVFADEKAPAYFTIDSSSYSGLII